MSDADNTGLVTFKDLSLRLKVIHCYVAIRSAVRRKRIRDVADRHLAEMREVYRIQQNADGWSCDFGGLR